MAFAKILMAPNEDEGAGTSPNPNAEDNAAAEDSKENTKESPLDKMLVSLNDTLQKMNERLAKVEQTSGSFNELIQSAVQKRSGSEAGEDEDEEVDETTQKFVAKATAPVRQQMQLLADQNDMIQFQNIARAAKVSSEELAQAEQRFAFWRKNNMTNNGVPFTRVEALAFTVGYPRLEQAVKDQTLAPSADQARLEANKFGTVERGTGTGTGGGGGSPKDPSKMTREQRLKSYYSEVLDKEGF